MSNFYMKSKIPVGDTTTPWRIVFEGLPQDLLDILEVASQ